VTARDQTDRVRCGSVVSLDRRRSTCGSRPRRGQSNTAVIAGRLTRHGVPWWARPLRPEASPDSSDLRRVAWSLGSSRRWKSAEVRTRRLRLSRR